jgi:glycosyltransferase involved in cell wall biosynthesis
VISSDASCLPEVGGDAALYFSPHDHELLAMHMLSVATDSNLRENMKAKGAAQAQHFTTDKYAASIMNVYQSIL